MRCFGVLLYAWSSPTWYGEGEGEVLLGEEQEGEVPLCEVEGEVQLGEEERQVQLGEEVKPPNEI